jgi:hypothetical protein
MPWFTQLVAGLSPRRPRSAPASVHVTFVEDKVALGQVLLRALQFSRQYCSSRTLHKHKSSGDEQKARWWLQFRDMVSPHQHEKASLCLAMLLLLHSIWLKTKVVRCTEFVLNIEHLPFHSRKRTLPFVISSLHNIGLEDKRPSSYLSQYQFVC